jgi:predicted nuclease of predicted toxin-antitoxin system
MAEEKIEEGMFVFDECIPFKMILSKLEELGYKGVSLTQTSLRKSGDSKIVEELKKINGVIFVTSDSPMYWKMILNKVPCVYLSVEGALLDVFMRNVKQFGERKKIKEVK